MDLSYLINFDLFKDQLREKEGKEMKIQINIKVHLTVIYNHMVLEVVI